MDSAPQSSRGCRSPDPLHQTSCSVFILVTRSWTIKATGSQEETIRQRCCCSVTKSCPTLCDPVDCSMPGLYVPHCLQSLSKFTSTEDVRGCQSLVRIPPVNRGNQSCLIEMGCWSFPAFRLGLKHLLFWDPEPAGFQIFHWCV